MYSNFEVQRQNFVNKQSLLSSIVLGMLNDYRIFDYRIKCSFSFSFVAHSILGFWKYRARVIVKERTDGTVQAKVDRSDRPAVVCSWPRAVTPRKSASPPTPRTSNAKLPYSHAAARLVGVTHVTQTTSAQLQPCTASWVVD